MRYSGEQVSRAPIQLRPATWRVGIKWALLAYLLAGLGRLVAWMIRHPWIVALIAAAVGMQVSMSVYGTTATVTPLAVLAAAMVVWRWRWPDSFDRLVWWPVKAIVRRAWVYRRGWQPAMTTVGLVERYNDHEFLPTLRRVRCVGYVDRVTVRMLPGQILDDYADQGERLAMTFGAQDCRVNTGKRHGELDLCFLTYDPLHDTVPPLPPADPPDLLALPVALREDGRIYQQQLLGNHILVAGATGSGKGSVLWSLLHALSPGLRSGLVEAWGIDPKGGMEFAIGQHLFARYCYGNHDQADDETEGSAHEVAFAEVLEAAVAIMQARQTRLRGVTRLHTPTEEEPLILIVIDELASLTAYVNDRDAKRRIRSALSMLLSQGRAVGVSVVAALQDPRKDVLPFRDLFPARIALRLTEREQVDMVLGDGYRARGARCDRIPTSLPGVAYVVEDGIPEPARIRFAYLSDEAIQTLGRPALRPVDDQGSEAA
ncbi:MAG: FtsK/SpoIIIE domain-containing protein [Pseudonocardiaceae bacterium]